MTSITCPVCQGKGWYSFYHRIEKAICVTNCGHCNATGIKSFASGEKIPYAYFIGDEAGWEEENVSHYYPEIVSYWKDKGITDIRVKPCGPVDEDCLYLNGQWSGYCRHEYEWKIKED